MQNISKRLLRWRLSTAALLTLGYGAYYICRTNLTVIGNMDTFKGPEGLLDEVEFGMLGSFGVFAYAIGKFINGGLADYLGGANHVYLWHVCFNIGNYKFWIFQWIDCFFDCMDDQSLFSIRWLGCFDEGCLTLVSIPMAWHSNGFHLHQLSTRRCNYTSVSGIFPEAGI